MNRIQRLLARPVGGWVLLLLAVGCLLAIFRGDWDPCENAVQKDLRSPDGRLHAVLFTRGCGATTGDSVQLSLLPSGKKLPNEGGNVFAFSDRYPQAVSLQAGPIATVTWLSADTLEVRYDPRVPLSRTAPVPERVVVRYVQIPVPGA